MSFIQGRRVVIGFVSLIAVSSFVIPASYAFGAETQSGANSPSAQAARVAAKLTPSQLQTIAKLDPKELAIISKMDRRSLETVSKMDSSTLSTVSKMDSRAFGVASKMDRRTLGTVAKMDRSALTTVSKLDKNSIDAMAKMDSQGKLSTPQVKQSVSNVANKTAKKTTKQQRNSFF